MAVFVACSSVSVLQIAVLVVGQKYRNSVISGALVAGVVWPIAQTDPGYTVAFRWTVGSRTVETLIAQYLLWDRVGKSCRVPNTRCRRRNPKSPVHHRL